MISHKHKCIFVQVPKTGSTSIRVLLGKPIRPHLNLWEIKTLMESYWPVRGGRTNRIIESFYLMLSRERGLEIGRPQFDRSFKFGFVRSPWCSGVTLYERV